MKKIIFCAGHLLLNISMLYLLLKMNKNISGGDITTAIYLLIFSFLQIIFSISFFLNNKKLLFYCFLGIFIGVFISILILKNLTQG